jgi:hypothetical protein
MKTNILLLLIITAFIIATGKSYAQQEEPIKYYQMEPLDDSLFIHMQQEVFIDPPDPKAEIIVDLRDPNNSTVSIKGILFPFLAFKPETRAKIQTYPFKINLEESINFGSVFTRVIERLRINKLVSPPSVYQISPGLQYINPFFQVFGGERFGIPIKNDLGLSFGLGTPYSGPFETNFAEANVNILGLFAGIYSSIDEMTGFKTINNNNNLYSTLGYQIGYVIPFGNFLQVSYTDKLTKFTSNQLIKYRGGDGVDSVTNPHVKLINGPSINWEFRYPISVLGSTRAKLYFGQYLKEWHAGFTGRELSLAGSTFDFSFDAMPHSDVRLPEYVINILVQKIFESWGFSAIAIGPSAVFGTDRFNRFTSTSLFINIRIKVGSSL